MPRTKALAKLLFGLLCLGFWPVAICEAQPKAELRSAPTIPPAEGEKLARALITDLLAQKPESSTNTGMLKIRARGAPAKEIPVRIEFVSTPTNCSVLYEVQSSAFGTTRLRVVHTDAEPNHYFLSEAGMGNSNAVPKELAPSETMIPFAGSDFWVADLGLEFLHWSKQRILRKELRLSQSCDVLESINPQPAPGGYARVVSWIDKDNGGVVHADAYDVRETLVKDFAPTELKTVHGQKQVEEIEMHNRQTGSRSWIKFNLRQTGG